ncbi:hypothetical protein ACSSS7_000003 [Eimeria intestinalis]
MDGLGSGGGLSCSGGGVPYGGPVDHSVEDHLQQHGADADADTAAGAAAAAAAATQQHQVSSSSSPHVGMHAVSAYGGEAAGAAVAPAGGASSAAGRFGGDVSAGGPPAVVPYPSLSASPEGGGPPSHYAAADNLDPFVSGGVACADAYHHHHGVADGLNLEQPPPPHSAIAGDGAGMGCGGASHALGSPSPALGDISTAASCGGGGSTTPSEPATHPTPRQQGASPPTHFVGSPDDGSACNGGNVSSSSSSQQQQQPRVGGGDTTPMREASADQGRETATTGGGGGPPSSPSSLPHHPHHHPMAAYQLPPDQQGEDGGGASSSSSAGVGGPNPHHPPLPEPSQGSGAVGLGGDPPSFGMQGGIGGGTSRSGIEKYLQWLDAIHTACSKLDDLCSKLDRSFPNATREWEATSPGIRGARQLFQMYATSQHMHPSGSSSSLHDELFNANSRKRQRRDLHAHPHNGMGVGGGGTSGGGPSPPTLTSHSHGGSTTTGLAHDTFAGAPMSMPGGGVGGAAGMQHMQHASTGAGVAASIGMSTGPYGAHPGGVGVDHHSQLKAAVGGGGGGSTGPSLSLPLSQQCTSSSLPGTANTLPPAGVPVGATSLADGAEYEYLLDFPEQEAPDPGKPGDLKCDVAGVYWDKRSWIASWYEGGKRYYKSFSAKTHGFYRSKYWAIKVRLSKVQSHALAGKGIKARATAA